MSTNPILSYAAAESCETDAWGELVRSTIEAHASTIDRYMEHVAALEADAKASGLTAMPGAWRSAKSVLKSAIVAGVPLLDSDGTALGKTALERAAKAAVTSITSKSPEETADGMASTLAKYCTKHGLRFEDVVSPYIVA